MSNKLVDNYKKCVTSSLCASRIVFVAASVVGDDATVLLFLQYIPQLGLCYRRPTPKRWAMVIIIMLSVDILFTIFSMRLLHFFIYACI